MNATKVNAGPAESSGRLLLGIWRDSLHVTCGLTACTPGSAPGPTLGNEYGKTLPFTQYRFLAVNTVLSTCFARTADYYHFPFCFATCVVQEFYSIARYWHIERSNILVLFANEEPDRYIFQIFVCISHSTKGVLLC